MTPEVKVKKQVKAILDAHNVYYFYPVTGGYGASGVPDIIGCINGMFIGIECKAGRNKPTKLQVHNLTRIAEAGGIALVINEDNVDDVRIVIDKLVKLSHNKPE